MQIILNTCIKKKDIYYLFTYLFMILSSVEEQLIQSSLTLVKKRLSSIFFKIPNEN